MIFNLFFFIWKIFFYRKKLFFKIFRNIISYNNMINMFIIFLNTLGLHPYVLRKYQNNIEANQNYRILPFYIVLPAHYTPKCMKRYSLGDPKRIFFQASNLSIGPRVLQNKEVLPCFNQFPLKVLHLQGLLLVHLIGKFGITYYFAKILKPNNEALPRDHQDIQ